MDLVEARARGNTPTGRHPWETARVDVVRRLLARRVALADGAAALDIGCGDTFVAEHLSAAYPGVRFYGVDTGFSSATIEAYRRRHGRANLELFESLDAVTPQPDEARLVLLLDVLEHVADDAGFLASLRLRPYVTPATRLVITVPAFQSLYCSHDTALGHHRRYSRAQLIARIGGAGFSVVESGYFFASLLPLRALEAVRERWFGAPRAGRVTKLAQWNGGAALTAVFETMLAWDARAGLALQRIGLALPGLSVYAVCRTSA